MNFRNANPRQLLIAVAMIFTVASQAQAIDQAVAWVGGGGNNLWSNANNWNPNAAAPCNFGPVNFLVTIPANAGTIVFDGAMGSCEVKSLTLGDNTTLQIAAGTSLTVVETANICGIVSGVGGDFVATSSKSTAAEFSCDRARMTASAASNVAIDAVGYSSLALWSSAFGSFNTWDLMTATGEGSVLDLGSLQSINAGFSATGTSTNIHRVRALDGGSVLLPGVAEVVAPVRLHEELQFHLSGLDSTLDLSGLTTISTAGSGRTLFDVTGAASLNLSSLQSASHARFFVADESTIQDGRGPWTYDSLGLWSSAFGSSNTWDLMSATGIGSVLDLGSLQSINAGFSATGTSTNIHRVRALDGGELVLSSVQAISAPVRAHERVDFIVSGDDSVITLHSLSTTSTANNGSVWFSVHNPKPAGGAPASLRVLEQLAGPGKAKITLEHLDTELRVHGSMLLKPDIELRAPNGGTVAVGKRTCYSHTVEADLELGEATLHLNGNGDDAFPQYLEVGGFDLDLFCNFANDNFGVGTLVIGSPDQPTVVHLRDDIDNGNTGGGNREALYIFHEDGLRIHRGSTLVINDLNVYLCAEQVRIKDLFPPGVTVIDYDEGTIELGAFCKAGDFNCDGSVGVADLLHLLANWGACDLPDGCLADLDCDGLIGVSDLLILLANWG